MTYSGSSTPRRPEAQTLLFRLRAVAWERARAAEVLVVPVEQRGLVFIGQVQVFVLIQNIF